MNSVNIFFLQKNTKLDLYLAYLASISVWYQLKVLSQTYFDCFLFICCRKHFLEICMLHPQKYTCRCHVTLLPPHNGTLLQWPLPSVPRLAVLERSDVKYMWCIDIILSQYIAFVFLIKGCYILACLWSDALTNNRNCLDSIVKTVSAQLNRVQLCNNCCFSVFCWS